MIAKYDGDNGEVEDPDPSLGEDVPGSGSVEVDDPPEVTEPSNSPVGFDVDDEREPKDDTPEDAGTPGSDIWYPPDPEPTPEPEPEDNQN